MESAEASFVAMVMKRLHAVEAQNASLLELNKELSCNLQETSAALYLKSDLSTFSDGFKLDVSGLPFLQDPYVHYTDFLPELPLDKVHRDAIAFVGELTFAVIEGEPLLRVGRKDTHTLVSEFAEAVWGFWQGEFEGCFTGWEFRRGVFYMLLKY